MAGPPSGAREFADGQPGRDGLAGAMLDLQELAERLRRDCPWDREQTEKTIVSHTVEEAYETADAALAGDDAKLLDELGDLLFQVVFLALLLSERGQGDLQKVARGIHEKLVARHPHVFGDVEARTAGRVRENWERIKREQEGREGIFHDLPRSLPALLYARKIQRRAAAIGFEYPDAAGALADLDDELAELKAELSRAPEPAPEVPPDERQAAELGDVLFAAVNVARRLNADPELELRGASDRFVRRVEHASVLAAAEGRAFADLELAEQDRFFDLAKELACESDQKRPRRHDGAAAQPGPQANVASKQAEASAKELACESDQKRPRRHDGAAAQPGPQANVPSKQVEASAKEAE